MMIAFKNENGRTWYLDEIFYNRIFHMESIILHKFLFKFDIVEKELLIILDIFILFLIDSNIECC